MRRALLIIATISLGFLTLAFVVLLPAMIVGAPLALYGDPDANEWTLWIILLRAAGVLVAMWVALGLVAKFTRPRKSA